MMNLDRDLPYIPYKPRVLTDKAMLTPDHKWVYNPTSIPLVYFKDHGCVPLAYSIVKIDGYPKSWFRIYEATNA